MTSRHSVFLLTALLVIGCAHGTPQDTAREPKTKMKQAISIARAYIASHDIDVSGQFLSRVASFHDVYNPEKTGWVLTWAPRDQFTLDGEWSIYVYDNGQVKSPGE